MTGVVVERLAGARVLAVAGQPDAVVLQVITADGDRRAYELTRAEFRQLVDQWSRDAQLLGAPAGNG